MDPLLELDALEAYIQPVVPDAKIKLLNLPEVPEDNMLVLRFLEDDKQNVNAMFSENIRRWQVLYFNKRINKVVEMQHIIGQAFIHGITIPFKDEAGRMWYVRIRNFNTGQPQQTDSGFDYSLSILETVTKGVKSIERFEAMQEAILQTRGG